MPDNWEYPWYAAWDLAFHMIPFAPGLIRISPRTSCDCFCARMVTLHPNGQIPSYEWAFGDVNPPVHAWACWRVFQIDRRLSGQPDYEFLESVFHQTADELHLVGERQRIPEGNNIFEGGFLGLDNIGIFDRSNPLPTGGFIEQSDGTSWMAMYCLSMLKIALELASKVDRIYEDIASKFFEHFLYIAHAINGESGLWDEVDGFFYDRLRLPDGTATRMQIRSMVGLIPLFAVSTIDSDVIATLDGFRRRMEWFMKHRPDLCENLASLSREGVESRRILSILPRARLVRVLERMLDQNEFLSPHGIRSVSKYHAAHPFEMKLGGQNFGIDYEPAESRFGLFGGNSNWRGPIWFPVNYLLIESLQRYHYYFGDDLMVEFPSGSGQRKNLSEVACQLSRDLSHIFLRDANGRRPVYGGTEKLQTDPNFKERYVLFYEYFLSATTALESTPAIRPAGLRWSPSSFSKAANNDESGDHKRIDTAERNVLFHEKPATVVTSLDAIRRLTPNRA